MPGPMKPETRAALENCRTRPSLAPDHVRAELTPGRSAITQAIHDLLDLEDELSAISDVEERRERVVDMQQTLEGVRRDLNQLRGWIDKTLEDFANIREKADRMIAKAGPDG